MRTKVSLFETHQWILFSTFLNYICLNNWPSLLRTPLTNPSAFNSQACGKPQVSQAASSPVASMLRFPEYLCHLVANNGNCTLKSLVDFPKCLSCIHQARLLYFLSFWVPVLPGKSHGWRILVGYNPWGHKESDTTEWPHTHVSCTKGCKAKSLRYQNACQLVFMAS